MTSRSGKLSVLAGTLGVVACLAACGSADPMTGDTGPFVIGSMETVDSMPEGAIVVTPDQLASISYFTGINAADRLSLRRAMCEPSYSDEVIDAWVEFLRSDNVVGRLSGGAPHLATPTIRSSMESRSQSH